MAWFLTDPARADLDDIWWYIARDDVAVADKVIARLVERFDMLARQPLIGEACPELKPELRNFPVRPYVIYYAAEANEVTIFRVLHGARDVRRQFRLWSATRHDSMFSRRVGRRSNERTTARLRIES